MGIIAGFFVLYRKTKHNKPFSDAVFDIAFWAVIAGFIGARMYHVWNEWWFYQNHLGDILKVWEGGLAIHGALITGGITLYILSRKKHISFLRLLDLFAPAVLIGQVFGRFGNYFNEELFGRPLDAWWALQIHITARPAQYAAFETFHPLFAYEILLNAILFTAIMLLWKKLSLHKGWAIGMYAIGYGVIRFTLDFFRFDQFGFGPLTLAQWVSLLAIVVGIWLLTRRRSSTNERY